jgi:hypothetical protein
MTRFTVGRVVPAIVEISSVRRRRPDRHLATHKYVQRAAGLALVEEHDTTVKSPPGSHRQHLAPDRVLEPQKVELHSCLPLPAGVCRVLRSIV